MGPPVSGARRRLLSLASGGAIACCLAGLTATAALPAAPANAVHTVDTTGTTPRSAAARSAGSAATAGTRGGASGYPGVQDFGGEAAGVLDLVGGPRLAERGVVVSYPSRATPRLPNLPASAYVVADAGTGQVLAAKDPHGLYLPASTLKVLTAVTLLPLLNPNSTVVASSRAADVTPMKVGLLAGHRYQVSDLFGALLTISANDAAIALDEATGSYRLGVDLINAEARHLRAYDITVKDPNGLNAPGQYVSAYDLALVARQALKMPAFLRYDEMRTVRFPITAHHTVTLHNQNSLLTDYPGALGGKVGYTEAAQTTYIGLARRHGTTLIVTMLHVTPLTEVQYAEKLLNWGFTVDGHVQAVGTLVSPQPTASAPTKPKPVRDGTTAGNTPANGTSPVAAAAVLGLVAAAIVAALGLLLLRRRSAAR